jgi:hypothetical protein
VTRQRHLHSPTRLAVIVLDEGVVRHHLHGADAGRLTLSSSYRATDDAERQSSLWLNEPLEGYETQRTATISQESPRFSMTKFCASELRWVFPLTGTYVRLTFAVTTACRRSAPNFVSRIWTLML